MQSHHLVILKALTTCLLVTVCIIALIRQKKSTKQMSSEQAAESLRLTDPEAKFYKYDIPYICTITWMHGDYQSTKIHLQKRLEITGKKNPWLLGCIKLRQGSYHLMYSKLENGIDSNESSRKMLHVVGDEGILNVVSPSSSPISHQAPLSKLNGILHESGLFVRNGPHEPLFKVSVIPCSENPYQRFALLVQISHAVGDGATHYKLFNMLCSMEEDNIAAMIPERIADCEKLQIDTLGREESLLCSSGGNAIRAILDMLAQMDYGWVDAS